MTNKKMATAMVYDEKTNTRNETEIKVGMGVTYSIGSDCYPYEVVEIKSDRIVALRAMNFKMNPKGDYFGNQIWDITSNPNGSKMLVKKQKNGSWRKYEQHYDCNGKLGWHSASCGGISFGTAHAYQNPSF